MAFFSGAFQVHPSHLNCQTSSPDSEKHPKILKHTFRITTQLHKNLQFRDFVKNFTKTFFIVSFFLLTNLSNKCYPFFGHKGIIIKQVSSKIWNWVKVLTSTLTEFDITYSSGPSRWRPFSFNMPYSDIFLNF